MKRPETLTLYITRDHVNGEVLDVQLKREDAEFDTQAYIGSSLTLRTGQTLKADPRLEVYRVKLGRLIGTTDARTCRRRHLRRKRREDRRLERDWQVIAAKIGAAAD